MTTVPSARSIRLPLAPTGSRGTGAPASGQGAGAPASRFAASFDPSRILVGTPTFAYHGIALPDLSAAQQWRPGVHGINGEDANVRISATYNQLDQAMTAYLGQPELPNWMTFGKYASRQAGEQIQRLEETLKVIDRLDVGALAASMPDFLRNVATLGDQGWSLMELSRTPANFLKNLNLLRDSLVYGNTGVYADVARAYDLFLRSESQRKDGVAALVAAGYGKPPLDPQGFLLQAFQQYQLVGRHAAGLTPAERTAAIGRANMLIVTHEQMDVVQGPKVFGNPAIARLIQAFTPSMTVTDARGTQQLLPHGGNWADFATRMGFVDAPAGTPGAYVVKDPAGVTHNYIVNPDTAARQGTISAYFDGALNPLAAATMIHSAPAPLPIPPGESRNFFGRIGHWITGALVSLAS